ncbi:MAG: cation:proton antiporter [Candidatus Riflebacteria bacterium]|nr:cation:proton antiporter [Candidatus Riflebacteria bacterium]
MHNISSFHEIALILFIAIILGIAGQKLRQPLLIMFLATGILTGPSGLGILKSHAQIELLANIGIALLLFLVGLKLDINLIRTAGMVSLITGLGQIIFTSLLGFFIAYAMNMSIMTSAYLAVGLTFSSTIIIMKLLSDKKEIDSLHGQIAIGLLIVQDIAAIIALICLTAFGSAKTDGAFVETAVSLLLRSGTTLAVIILLMRFVFPGLTQRLAHSSEMMTLFAVSWAVFLAAATERLGFSKEVGAFLAGVSLASTDYRDAIGARLVSLRDFLLLFFFIDLGARLNWSTVGSQLEKSFLLSIFVLIGKPFIVMIIMGFMGYRRRTGFLAGLAVAQISEFSLILAALGLSLGHINQESMGLITFVGVVTIFASAYMILYSGQIYRFFSEYLRVFERKNPYRESAIDSFTETPPVDVILVGLGSYGTGLADYLLRRGKAVIGVDFDPQILEKWRNKGVSVLYGDMSDPEIHEQLPLNKANWVVSSVRSRELNLALLQNLKNRSFVGKIALTASNQKDSKLFDKAGADVVFRPFTDAAEQAADALTQAMDCLPRNVNWPVAFREVRVNSESSVAGQSIKNIPLRSLTGVSILAVSRAGRINYDLVPDFQIYPGDRLVIMGHPEELAEAERILNQLETKTTISTAEKFEIAEIKVPENSEYKGHTLADMRFRQNYGVTVIGIRRGKEQITSPSPKEKISAGDCLIVIGTTEPIEKLKKDKNGI